MMTVVKGVLISSATAIVIVAAAQAADLPTNKAAPVAEYVRICRINGVAGWTLPGSDICVRFAGYISAQFEGGNLSTQYNFALGEDFSPLSVSPFANGYTGQRVLVAASEAQQNAIFYRDTTGWATRASFGFDFGSNTPYGPLVGHFDLNSENGNGFDNLGTLVYLNTGYVTWAGITAGKAGSFFSFTAGGDNWANFFSPDRRGYNEPPLLAYTAAFRGGFSATLSFESPGPVGGFSGVGTDISACNAVTCNITFGGQRWPDIVGVLHVNQAWGEAQLSGVLHNVNVQDTLFSGADGCGYSGALACNGSENKVGWGVDAGVEFNLPWKSAFLLTGAYSQSAVWYSGLPNGMWGEDGQVNGNGQPMFMADAAFDPLTNAWATPTAWSVSALFQHRFVPAFYGVLEGSIGGLNWSNQRSGCPFFGAGCGGGQIVAGGLSPHATSWIVGADLGWNPAANLNFDLELMYESTIQERPSGLIGTVYNWDGQDGVGASFAPGAWNGVSNGFAGRLRMTRYF